MDGTDHDRDNAEGPPSASPQPAAPPVQAPSQPSEHDPPLRRRVACDAEGRIAEDIPCRQCGYNLRGLSQHQLCPECSLPVEKSVQADLLRFSDPGWVGRLARGTLLIIIGLLSTIVFGFISGMVFMFIGVASMTPAPGGGGAATTGMTATWWGTLITGLTMVISLGLSFVIVYGAWLLTTPDPAKKEQANPLNARTLARWCMLGIVASTPLGIMQYGANPWMGSGRGVGPMFYPLLIAGALLGAVVFIGYIAGLFHLRTLAIRLPREGLANQARTVGIALAIIFSLSFLMQIGNLILMPNLMTAGAMGGPPGPWFTSLMILGVVGCFVALGMLGFGVWAIVLLFLFHGAFKQAHAAALQHWDAQPVA